ncbi:uncharacterized protein LOC141930913 [Strix aluco]|uniref:uncharacterized protein LOC141930913 n=1 Tax=Strix aluco TaxID=111821 RepID=UPI003DA1CC49
MGDWQVSPGSSRARSARGKRSRGGKQHPPAKADGRGKKRPVGASPSPADPGGPTRTTGEPTRVEFRRAPGAGDTWKPPERPDLRPGRTVALCRLLRGWANVLFKHPGFGYRKRERTEKRGACALLGPGPAFNRGGKKTKQNKTTRRGGEEGGVAVKKSGIKARGAGAGGRSAGPGAGGAEAAAGQRWSGARRRELFGSCTASPTGCAGAPACLGREKRSPCFFSRLPLSPPSFPRPSRPPSLPASPPPAFLPPRLFPDPPRGGPRGARRRLLGLPSPPAPGARRPRRWARTGEGEGGGGGGGLAPRRGDTQKNFRSRFPGRGARRRAGLAARGGRRGGSGAGSPSAGRRRGMDGAAAAAGGPAEPTPRKGGGGAAEGGKSQGGSQQPLFSLGFEAGYAQQPQPEESPGRQQICY